MRSNATSTLDVKLPLSRASWTTRTLQPVVGLFCQTFDLAALGSVAFSIFILSPLSTPNISVFDFLHLRITFAGLLIAVVCICMCRMILWVGGMYTPRRTRSLVDYIVRCLAGLLGCTGLVTLIEWMRLPNSDLIHDAGVFASESLLLMVAARAGMVLFFRYLRPLLRTQRKLVILGTGMRAVQVYRDLKDHELWDYSLLGFVDSEPQATNIPPEMILGGTDELEDLLMHHVVDEVVIALPMKSQYEIIGRAISICERLGIQSQYFSDHFGTTVTKRRFAAGPQTGRIVMQVVHHDYRRYVKRIVDFSGALIGLVFLSPVFLATALLVKLTSKGPVLFRQERFGLNKRHFSMLKFRSMCLDAEARQANLEPFNETTGPAFKIRHDPRVTPIGTVLRKLSIDELPQLLNVLMGDMSLVGPRPLPMRDVNRFSEAWLMRRFSVKPGITCLWQVMGRSNTDFDRWIQLDLQYIDNWSLSLDLMILLRTIPAVFKGNGAV